MRANALVGIGVNSLVDAVDGALPQTQCTRCGFADCRRYAEAIVDAGAPIDRCPPGGRAGVARLADLTGRPAVALDPANGSEGPRRLAVIDESWCIGCTLCLKACPVDCIVGGPKLMHTVVAAQCTGCELCLPSCPVDCISLEPIDGDATGWDAWSPRQAGEANERYAWHRARRERDDREHDARLRAASRGLAAASTDAPTRLASGDAVQAALARARANRVR